MVSKGRGRPGELRRRWHGWQLSLHGSGVAGKHPTLHSVGKCSFGLPKETRDVSGRGNGRRRIVVAGR